MAFRKETVIPEYAVALAPATDRSSFIRRTYIHLALAILEDCGGEGPESPQHDYFACYRVLAATGQGEDARAALQSAYNMVMARADKITDSALRQSFLEQVELNHEIVQEYANVIRET